MLIYYKLFRTVLQLSYKCLWQLISSNESIQTEPYVYWYDCMNQVVLLNDHTETRTIKLGLYLSECCVDMEIISTTNELSKHKQNSLILLGKSGRVYQYDDSLIEKYLLQGQSKSTHSLPKEVMVRLPFVYSSITTIAKFISNTTGVFYSADEVIG